MGTLTLKVGPDGLVKIPGTQPGQTVIVTVESAPLLGPAEEYVFSPAEREQLIKEQMEESRRFREQADPKWLTLDHDEWLYGPDGLPK